MYKEHKSKRSLRQFKYAIAKRYRVKRNQNSWKVNNQELIQKKVSLKGQNTDYL